MAIIQTKWYQWLPFLLRGKPHQVISNESDPRPYLLRWYLLPRNRFLNVYLHKFLRSDDDRAMHDHPWWFISMVLRGNYIEHTERGKFYRKPFRPVFRHAEHRHVVKLIGDSRIPDVLPIRPGMYVRERPCWTIIVTGRTIRTWGFWCENSTDASVAVEFPNGHRWYPKPKRFVPHNEWDNAAGCGEP